MYNGKTFLAIIPARGGSKGLPRKNILPLLGKPLIVWTIEQAKKSKYLDRIIVSTEDEEIMKVSKSFSAEVLQRPKDLAQDNTPTSDVIIHVIETLEKEGYKYDFIVLLEPTSPLRKDDDIDNAIKIIVDTNSISLVSVTNSDKIDLNFVFLLEDNKLKSIFYGSEFNILPINRQDFTKIYYPEGTIYISETFNYIKRKTFYHNETRAFIVEKWQAYEIDDIYDFVCIESILKYKMEVIK
jgi:CMP-N,N'-diacetyllegionaminic acid synthase